MWFSRARGLHTGRVKCRPWLITSLPGVDKGNPMPEMIIITTATFMLFEPHYGNLHQGFDNKKMMIKSLIFYLTLSLTTIKLE